MIDSWKNNLLNLPDSVFFDIMRNYLGDLKTPFNKHDLMRSLTKLISKKEIRAKIFSLIDHDDSRLLTAIALLNTAGIDELYEFTRQYYSFLELHNRIANLQERLLICIEDKRLIKLNPVFEEELKEDYLDSAAIFSSLSVADEPGNPWLNEQFIAALLSFFINNRNIFNQNLNSRKKAEGRLAAVFPWLTEADSDEPVSFLIRMLSTLGFISISDSDPEIIIDNILSFGKQPVSNRRILTAAAAVSAWSDDKAVSPETLTCFLSTLFSSLKPGSRLHENDLKSFFYLIRRNINKTDDGAANLTDDLLTEALCFCGFMIKDDDFRQFTHGETSPVSGEKIRIQSNFDITAPAAFPFNNEILTALSCEISSYDITRTYELKKSSFAAALDAGLTLGRIRENMTENSTGGIPQNIQFSLNAWEKEYNSINLKYGVVMIVERERLPLIEHSPGLKDFFTASPAQGVFILDPAREPEWRRAFADAGFDMLPRIIIPHAQQPIPETGPAAFKRFKLTGKTVIQNYSATFKPQTDDIIGKISEKIRRLSVSTENKQKLEARAKKKLILADSQLSASNKPEERGEAGGLDHRAKIRLTERALELDNLLEITTAKDLELEKRLIKPLRLVKSDAETPDKPPVYRIEAIELPEETQLTVSITRISYMRMLKSSLFTP